MFEEPVDYSDRLNILADIFYTRNQRKHSSHNKPDLNSGIACLIKAFNNCSICKVIQLQMDIRLLPGFCIFYFGFY